MLLSYGAVKTLESPLNSKEIIPVSPKRNQSWIFIGRTDAEAPILWPNDSKSWLIGKVPDPGKDWGQERGAAEGEMVGWHHQHKGHEFEQTPGDSVKKPGMLLSMRSQRIEHVWVSEQYIQREESTMSRSYLKPYVHSIIIYSNQDMKTI